MQQEKCEIQEIIVELKQILKDALEVLTPGAAVPAKETVPSEQHTTKEATNWLLVMSLQIVYAKNADITSLIG